MIGQEQDLSRWTRRAWLATQSQALVFVALRLARLSAGTSGIASVGGCGSRRTAAPLASPQGASSAVRLDMGPLQALVQHAIDAAMAAGAQYADARVTRSVVHMYNMPINGHLFLDTEDVGLGVRVLVNGYWGFAASPFWTRDEAARLAHDAVAQAKDNARGPSRPVELGHVPVVTGEWTTPHQIDPFAIPVEEKLDAIRYWKTAAGRARLEFVQRGLFCGMTFARQERVLATSEGSLCTQTTYESGGNIDVVWPLDQSGQGPTASVTGLAVAGTGWELFLDAHIPEQFPQLRAQAAQQLAVPAHPATIGRYTVVCDGVTMANMLDRTLGMATQLDRALGYEANATGTSFLTDPLGMLGQFTVASPIVHVTANRSVPAQLGTVQWDDEGVAPDNFPLVKDGVLVDFQTTREQAAWLAPYYTRRQLPVRSHGCAAAQDAHGVPLQMVPNLAMAPSASAVGLTDLVADVTDGILITNGRAECDFQATTGLLTGEMRKITHGRLGAQLTEGAILFNTLDFWRHVTAVGGLGTQGVVGFSQYPFYVEPSFYKGQPPQVVSHSAQAVAALIPNQPLINPLRKA